MTENWLVNLPMEVSVLPDWSHFFLTWLRKPLDVAALAPSGPWVAAAVAKNTQLDRDGYVLELGGGTGSITEGLLKGGCPVERLIVIEREPKFVEILRRRFPGLTVIQGDATELGKLMAERSITKLASVVSTLPIKWFPVAAQRSIVDQSFRLMGPGGHFVQITNHMVSPLPRKDLDLAGEEMARIWLSVLPVQVWSYRPLAEIQDNDAFGGMPADAVAAG